MNVVALISSVIGLLIIMLIVQFGRKIKNQLLRFLILVSGTIMAVGVAGNIPYILGDPAASTSAKAGEYLLYLGVIYLLLQAILKKRQKPGDDNS